MVTKATVKGIRQTAKVKHKTNLMRMDPSRTSQLRRRFDNEIKKRFNALKKEIIRHIVELDTYGLKKVDHPLSHLPSVRLRLNILTGNYDPDQPRDDHGRFGSGGGGGDSASEAHSSKDEAQHDHEVVGKLPPHEQEAARSLIKRVREKVQTIATNLMLKAGELAPDILDTASDYQKISYTGGIKGIDPVQSATGVSANTAILIASHVLGRVAVALKRKLKGVRTHNAFLFNTSDRVEAVLDVLLSLQKEIPGLPIPTRKSVEQYLKQKEAVKNADFAFSSDADKIKAFKEWLSQQVQYKLLDKTEDELWRKFVEEGLARGAGRAFDEINKVNPWTKQENEFYAGSKEQFLKSAFNQPVAIEKVQLMAGRGFNELEGITDTMSTRMVRRLTEGIASGDSPREIARDLVGEVNISLPRALTISRTEVIRAQAEGQLIGMEQLGIEEVGVYVEWSTAGDNRVCPHCAALEGKVYTIEEAKGMLPLHPNCRCAWIPSTKQDKAPTTKGQKPSEEKFAANSRVMLPRRYVSLVCRKYSKV